MQWRRRELMIAGGASLLAAPGAAAEEPALDAVEDTTLPPLPPSLAAYSGAPSIEGPITDYAPFGTNPPTPLEVRMAKRVLDGIPNGLSPFGVAHYFLDVGAGKYGEDLRPYVMAWPVRWNPVIVQFFKAIHSTPSGDTTAWCSAFVNYCLLRAYGGGAKPPGSADPTLSAASASFRSWSRRVNLEAGEKPRQGDVVVFRRKDSAGQGHVGFFVAEEGSRVLVLGGNQFEGTPRRHVVNRKWLGKDSAVLAFHSYRTDPVLHV